MLKIPIVNEVDKIEAFQQEIYIPFLVTLTITIEVSVLTAIPLVAAVLAVVVAIALVSAGDAPAVGALEAVARAWWSGNCWHETD